MFKNKIYSYYFFEFFKIFLIITFSISFLIWITQAARLLELITEFGNPPSIYIQYIIFNYPKILEKLFLLCFTVSMFFVFAKMQTSNEISIYWLSGVSKIRILKLTLFISLFLILSNLIISALIAPWSSAQGRYVLGKSKFTMINSLVKEKNFNTPLKGLTIYVDSNDRSGNLQGIFIYENDRTIIAKRGQVLSNDDGSFLKLFDGITQEKINNRINMINFKNTIFDFTKYQLQNTKDLKFNELSTFWLIKNINNNEISKLNEVREELIRRLFKPFLIFFISIASCFLLFSNYDKIGKKKLNISVYTVTISVIILNEALIGIGSKSLFLCFLYFLTIIILNLFAFLFFKKIIKYETS